jgi:hypothetical protein
MNSIQKNRKERNESNNKNNNKLSKHNLTTNFKRTGRTNVTRNRSSLKRPPSNTNRPEVTVDQAWLELQVKVMCDQSDRKWPFETVEMIPNASSKSNDDEELVGFVGLHHQQQLLSGQCERICGAKTNGREWLVGKVNSDLEQFKQTYR